MPGQLISYGWNDRVAGLFSEFDTPSSFPGRVIRVDRGSALVATDDVTVRASPHALASRRHDLDAVPATGDWVAVVDDPDEGWAVVAVVPRWSSIGRKDPEEATLAEQVLAANVDVFAAVTALDRPVSRNRLERMLVVAWESGATPVVVLTKADLCDDVNDMDKALRAAEEAAAGVDVFVTSAATGAGVDGVGALAEAGRTLALLGPSGAGKSSLVNRLLGAEVQTVGDVRALDHRGRHTTTTRDLIPLPGGGVLLDTPGLRSLPLWEAEEGLAAAFSEIEELGSECRFRDCGHDREPGCAVKAAIADGSLDRRRFDSYRKLQRELERIEERKTAHERRSEAKRFARSIKVREKLNPNRKR